VGYRGTDLNPAQSRISSDQQSGQSCLAGGSGNECSVRGSWAHYEFDRGILFHDTAAAWASTDRQTNLSLGSATCAEAGITMAHAAFLNPVAFHNTFYRSSIVSRGQPGHHPFPHRSLQLSVLLQPTVAL